MKVTITKVFFDSFGLHRKGSVEEVEEFKPGLMELVAEEKPKKKSVVKK